MNNRFGVSIDFVGFCIYFITDHFHLGHDCFNCHFSVFGVALVALNDVFKAVAVLDAPSDVSHTHLLHKIFMSGDEI